MSEKMRIERVDLEDDEEQGIDRRRFVGMVSGSVAASWLLRPPGAVWAAGDLPEGDDLVPGYLWPSHLMAHDEAALCRLSDPRYTYYETIRAAIPEHLPLEFLSSAQVHGAPEHFQSGSARVWAHGLMPPDHVREDHELLSAHLEVEVAIGRDSHRHHAWSFSREPVANVPAPTSFVVPVGERSELRLHMTLERDGGDSGLGGAGVRGEVAGSTARTYTTVLSLEDRYEQPGLRAGIYALPLSATADGALPLPANHDWLVPEKLPFLLMTIQPLSLWFEPR